MILKSVYLVLLMTLGVTSILQISVTAGPTPPTTTPRPAVNEKKKADKVPILWPVKPGTNWISCPEFQRTRFLQKKYQYILWYKCIDKCQSEHHHVWKLLARMNNEWSIHYENGTDALYTLSTDGILEIRNVTVADNNTEYRCTVRTWSVVHFHILLLYYEEKQVDGNWSAWGAWSPCSKPCGYGTSTRERVCNNPVPAHGGASCIGNTNEAQVCLVGHCSTPPTTISTKLSPVDGNWSAWGAWSPCNKTCGYGTSTRARVCNNPVPAHVGAACRGDAFQTRGCSVGECSTPPTSIPKKSPPDHTCTKWMIGCIVAVLFLVLAIVMLALQRRRYRRGQAHQSTGVAGATYVVNSSDCTISGALNQGNECGSKETLDNDYDDDDDMVKL